MSWLIFWVYFSVLWNICAHATVFFNFFSTHQTISNTPDFKNPNFLMSQVIKFENNWDRRARNGRETFLLKYREKIKILQVRFIQSILALFFSITTNMAGFFEKKVCLEWYYCHTWKKLKLTCIENRNFFCTFFYILVWG